MPPIVCAAGTPEGYARLYTTVADVCERPRDSSPQLLKESSSVRSSARSPACTRLYATLSLSLTLCRFPPPMRRERRRKRHVAQAHVHVSKQGACASSETAEILRAQATERFVCVVLQALREGVVSGVLVVSLLAGAAMLYHRRYGR